MTAGGGAGKDAGSGTVWMILVVSVIWAGSALILGIGGAVAARHRAGAAADLAALAAADSADRGASAACDRARAVAAAQHGSLVGCVVDRDVADVVVAVQLPGRLSSLPLVRARARAGPEGTG